MEETKVQIGKDVLLDIGTHSEWYISAVGTDGETVDVQLRRKADKDCKWWLDDTQQPNEGEWIEDEYGIPHCNRCNCINNTVYKNYCPNCGAYMKGEER